MLVFGPYRAIPKSESFSVFNLTSPVQAVERLPGLIVLPPDPAMLYIDGERSFDQWYYDYVLDNDIACSSLMMILQELYNGNNVYICIADYASDDLMSTINESFMKILQVRYDIKYSIINTEEDIDFVDKDGCVFMSVMGINNFDADRKRYMQLCTENNILYGKV